MTRVLALDSAGPHCAVALWEDGASVASVLEPMARGQVERLMPLVDDTLTRAGWAYDQLDGIGVGIGPGNFTGVRLAVSAARGLALALSVQAIGVSRFDVLAKGLQTPALGLVDAPRDQVYAMGLGGADAVRAPRLMPLSDAERLGLPLLRETPGDNPAPAIAAIAAARLGEDLPRPAPLYIKAPDAAPAKDAPPRIIP